MSRRNTRWLVTVLSVLATALVAAACGSTSSSSTAAAAKPASSTPAAATSTPAASTAVGGLKDSGVTNYLTYTDGKAGPANPKLAPVQIGWVNQQGGQEVIGPLATPGAELAIKYINQELGGIDGHPLQLDTCFIASSEQQGTTCGQQFVANKNIDVIDEGAVVVGIQPLYSTLAGKKPVIAAVTAQPVDSVQKNATVLFGDPTHVLGPIGTYAKEVLHAKTAAVIYAQYPGNAEAAALLKGSLQAEGITVKSVGYDPSDTALTQPIEESGATSADIVVPFTEASGCVSLARGLQQLGVTDPKKIVSAPLCLSQPVKQALGDYPKWTYGLALSLFGDPTDPGMPAYMKVVGKYGVTAEAPDPWFTIEFSNILTTARFMNELGYGHITPAAIEAKAHAFTGPLALGAPSLKCGQYSSAPAVCNNKVQFFAYEGNNKFVKTAGWLQPPPGF